MARQKPKASAARKQAAEPAVRRYRTRGVEVEIRETSQGLRGARAADRQIDLTLDGKRIAVEMVDGKYHSQLANQFMAFDTIDEVVDTLLANEGRTWTLHGHFCGEQCGPAGHHHGKGEGGHGHDDPPPDHGHGHRRRTPGGRR